MMKYVLIVIVLFTVALGVRMPSETVLWACNLNNHLACSALSSEGSIWHGELDELGLVYRQQGMLINTIEWQWSPLSILMLRPRVEVAAEGLGATLNTIVAFDSQHLQLENLMLDTPISLNGFSGNLMASIDLAKLSDSGQFLALKGGYLIDDSLLEINNQQYFVNEVSGTLTFSEGKPLINILSKGGDLVVEGTCTFDFSFYGCDIIFDLRGIHDSTLALILSRAGSKISEGIYRLEFEGGL